MCESCIYDTILKVNRSAETVEMQVQCDKIWKWPFGLHVAACQSPLLEWPCYRPLLILLSQSNRQWSVVGVYGKFKPQKKRCTNVAICFICFHWTNFSKLAIQIVTSEWPEKSLTGLAKAKQKSISSFNQSSPPLPSPKKVFRHFFLNFSLEKFHQIKQREMITAKKN